MTRNFSISIYALFASVLWMFQSCSITKGSYVEYHQYVSRAEYHFYNQEFSEAVSYYEEAFSIVETPIMKDRYNWIRSLNMSGSEDRAIELLNKLSSYYIDRDSVYFSNLSHEERARLKLSYTNAKSLITDSIRETGAFDQLEQILELDQKYRKLLSDSILVYYSEGSEIASSYKDSLVFYDSINRIQFLEFINEFGFPAGINDISKKGEISSVMLHLPLSFLIEHEETFLNQLEQGYLPPDLYFSALDRHFHDRTNGACLYCQYSTRNPYDAIPEDFFKRLSEKGLSPYFILTDRIYGYGQTPHRTKYYDHFMRLEDDLNPINFKPNLIMLLTLSPTSFSKN